ncbi:hypothetical protein [Ancylobacter polymorphus]|uniref:Uncharacterized protein n=1 Tax=Ancylobacter polymorphus TaxID=223390 RepID=A0A9E7CVA9_9HYPH|nr:hypothetical protein [Ancylobacter polymorphus]UOK69249.1 hypothetical protein K9D25_10745 [Ancylobacter polymorphus]
MAEPGPHDLVALLDLSGHQTTSGASEMIFMCAHPARRESLQIGIIRAQAAVEARQFKSSIRPSRPTCVRSFWPNQMAVLRIRLDTVGFGRMLVLSGWTHHAA